MVYSDEALTEADGHTVLRYALRPAFSLEYLRSHPYIVHLVGFRASLLRSIGGWNEGLSISQDYDLILRIAERAKKIVHIPEVLYCWRIHGSSAGIEAGPRDGGLEENVLRGHLERSGVNATVEDGPSFNLFSVRYPLQPGLKVAIVIPTKNHGDLLRQCVASIRATVKEVAYDIVVVDHESDERSTLDYLDSIAATVKVLRYAGPFNFSAINNWAVSKLGDGYTHYLLCNNDIEAIEPGWLERMLRARPAARHRHGRRRALLSRPQDHPARGSVRRHVRRGRALRQARAHGRGADRARVRGDPDQPRGRRRDGRLRADPQRRVGRGPRIRRVHRGRLRRHRPVPAHIGGRVAHRLLPARGLCTTSRSRAARTRSIPIRSIRRPSGASGRTTSRRAIRTTARATRKTTRHGIRRGRST